MHSSFLSSALLIDLDAQRANTNNSLSRNVAAKEEVDDTMKYSDRHLAGLSAGPPDRVELIGAGSLGYGTGPSFG